MHATIILSVHHFHHRNRKNQPLFVCYRSPRRVREFIVLCVIIRARSIAFTRISQHTSYSRTWYYHYANRPDRLHHVTRTHRISRNRMQIWSFFSPHVEYRRRRGLALGGPNSCSSRSASTTSLKNTQNVSRIELYQAPVADVDRFQYRRLLQRNLRVVASPVLSARGEFATAARATTTPRVTVEIECQVVLCLGVVVRGEEGSS